MVTNVYGWFIDINTLEELINFKNKYGELVLQNSIYNEDIIVIEIYDTYRE